MVGLQADFLHDFLQCGLHGVVFRQEGREDQARALLNELMEDSVRETMALAGSLAREIGGEIAARGGAYGPRKEFLEAYCGRVAMPLFSGA